MVISGGDSVIYIPMTGVPAEFSAGSHVSFTAVPNVSEGNLYQGLYKPVDVLGMSLI